MLLVHIDSICLGHTSALLLVSHRKAPILHSMKNTASKGHTSAISLIREQMLGWICEIATMQYHTKVSYVLRQLFSKR